MSASRQPEALSSRKDGSFDAETLQRSVDLDDAAVTRAVAAGHRRLPRELSARRNRSDRAEHRFRAARKDVHLRVDELGHENGINDDLGARKERRGFGVLGRTEAGDNARRAAKLLGEVREWRNTDPAADEKRSLDVESVAVPERPEDRDLVTGVERGDRLRFPAR